MLIYTSYREKEACSALRDIARVNGRSEDIDVVAMGNKEKRYMFLWYNDPTDITRRGFGQIKVERNSVMDIFKPITLPYTLAFMFGWPMITFLRFGVNDIGGIFEDSYQTNYIRGVLEISGLLLTAVIEGFMGRRCLLLTLLTSISIAFFAISFPTLPIETKKGLFWFSNIPTTSANTLIILFTLCVYPTSLRSITIGLFTALSCIGEVVAPLAIDYAPYKLRNQDTAFFAMGFVALVGEKQIHNIFSLFTDSSQELASAITYRRCATLLLVQQTRFLQLCGVRSWPEESSKPLRQKRSKSITQELSFVQLSTIGISTTYCLPGSHPAVHSRKFGSVAFSYQVSSYCHIRYQIYCIVLISRNKCITL